MTIKTEAWTSPQWSSPILASYPSITRPLRPTLRANPYPEVTDLFCRLPLSTLFYWLEATHLGDLRRLWVRPGVRIIHAIGFSRAVESAPDDAKKYTAFPEKKPYRQSIWFQGLPFMLSRKENSTQGSRQRPQFRLCYHSISTSRFRNINLIPFR